MSVRVLSYTGPAVELRASWCALVLAVLFSMLVLLPSTTRADEAIPLSLGQAIELAKSRSQLLVAQQAAAAAARQMAIAAGKVPDPDSDGRRQQPAGQRSRRLEPD